MEWQKDDKNKAICKFCDTDFFGTNGKNGGIYSLDKLIKKLIMFGIITIVCKRNLLY